MEYSTCAALFYFYTEIQNKVDISTIHDKLVNVWSTQAPSLRTLYRCREDFSSGSRATFSDAPRSGRPVVRDEEMARKIEQLVEENPLKTLSNQRIHTRRY